MRAQVLESPGAPLVTMHLPVPQPGQGELRVAVSVCGVCRTDLHIADGELRNPKLPLIPGHEVVGVVDAVGSPELQSWLGRRVGVPWLGWTCGRCEHCLSHRENLCVNAQFHGYTRDGGYAEAVLVDSRFVVDLPPDIDDTHAAPLLCAGLIGFRALTAAGEGARIGLYGFGASAHIVAQLLQYQRREVFAFVRRGDSSAAEFARRLGVAWAGFSDEAPPALLDAAIIFAPVGSLVPEALKAVRAGGTVVCAGIHMSDIPSFPYSLLWGERVIRSVANLQRHDGQAFFRLFSHAPIRTEVTTLPLERANDALSLLRAGDVRGAIVLDVKDNVS